MLQTIQCPYCNKMFSNYNGLSKHIIRYKKHGDISKEQLLADFKYNGIIPLCQCGCNLQTKINNEKPLEFRRFLYGHHQKIINNWGHNPSAIKKSAETRKKQYANGERIQWNKDKKWNETYTKEKIAKLSEIYRTSIKNRIRNNKFSLSSKEENDFIEKCIKPLNVEFKQQYYIKDIHQFCDVFIPSKKLIIEFNGSYWHGDKRIYNENKLNKCQKARITKDCIKKEWAVQHGYKILFIWELDYKKNIDYVKKQIVRLFQ